MNIGSSSEGVSDKIATSLHIIDNTLDTVAAIARNVAAHSQWVILAQECTTKILERESESLESLMARCKANEAAKTFLARAEWFNVVKRGINYAMLEKHSALVNSFHRIGDLTSRINVANQLVSFAECARRSPQFARNIIQALSLRRWTTFSRKAFIQNHLMHIAEFRALLKLEGKAFTKAWLELMDVVKKVINYLWRSIIRASIQPKRFSSPIPVEAQETSKKEQLWPLLLAFKNQ